MSTFHNSHEASFLKMGGTRPDSLAAIPKCKESAYWKHKEREEFGDLDHEFFYRHAFTLAAM